MIGRVIGALASLDAASARLLLRDITPGEASESLLLEAMLTIRLFEERVRELRLAGDISGSVHLEIGQEAVAVGSLLALRPGDPVLSTYRGHGWALSCGSTLSGIFAELLGRECGVNGGRGGSAYFSDVEHGFYGENSIVGAGAPIACGAALAIKRTRSQAAVLTAFGDGAMNQGSVSEALNLAAAFELPVIFLCENNRYSELTLLADVVPNDRLHERGAPYDIPSVRIDGNDPWAVCKAVTEAAARARAGEGPSLIEAMTERIVGHYIGDPELYRMPGEVERLREDEPIARLLRTVPAAEAERVSERVGDVVTGASAHALAAAPADPGSVRDFLYSDGVRA